MKPSSQPLAWLERFIIGLALMFVMTARAQPCAPMPSGLVSWWKGEGNATDQLGLNNGSLQNGATFAPGLVGQAISFDGTNDFVQVPRSPSLLFSNQLTIELWMKPFSNSPIPAVQGLVTSDFYGVSLLHGAPGSRFGIEFYLSINGGAYFYDLGDAPISFDQWHHVAGTFDGTKMLIYIDGQVWGSPMFVSGTISPMLANSFVAIGSESGRTVCACQNRFSKGLVDEVGIYSRALLPVEIAAIHNSGATGKCFSLPYFYVQPTNQTVFTGANVTLSAIVGGEPTFTYQWQFNGTNLGGATAATLYLTNVQPDQAGSYILQVTNAMGTATSSNAVLTVLPPSGCVPPPSGLVSWWSGEGNAIDLVGTNHGIIEPGVTFTAGEVNQAFNFNGTNASLRMPASPSLDVGLGGGFTIEAWIKPADLVNPLPIGEWNSGAFGVNFYTSAYSAGSLFISVKDVNLNEHQVFSGGGLLNTNSLQHVAATYDKSSGNTVLYLNGALVAQGAFGVFTPLTSGDFNIGLRPYGPGAGRRFKGVMDEYGLYSRALTGAEIAAIYNAGAAGKCSVQAAPYIYVQPTNSTVLAGANYSFFTLVSGTAPLSYQWQFNGTNITGATNAILTLTNIQPTQSGTYVLQITNIIGTATSSNAVLTVIATPNCVPLPSGLVSWWRADGDVADQIGTNSGTLQNGATFGNAPLGQAFSLDGLDDYVRIPRSPGLLISNQVTIECWIKPASNNPMSSVQGLITSDFYGLSFSYGGSPQNRVGVNFFLSINNGAPYHEVADANGGGALISSNQWHHIAGTYDGTKMLLYIDGSPWGNPMIVSGTISPMLANSFLAIGSESGRTTCACQNRFFNGMVDEASIYDRALSASELAAIYNAGAAEKCASPTTPYFFTHPTNRTTMLGSNAFFSAIVGGTSPLQYQWLFNSSEIPSATNSTLNLTNVQPSKGGLYSLRVSNSVGGVVSSNATLNVVALFAYGNGQPLTNSAYSFGSPVTIQIQSAFVNGQTFYTLDGTPPSFLSTPYTGSFIASNSITLRVLGYSADFFEYSELGPVSVLLPPTYSLTGSTAGGGTIASNPPGGIYFSNTVVSVTATPAAGWTFLQWLGDLAGSNNPGSVTMTRDKRVQAVFGTALSTTAAGGGSVTKIPASGLHPFGSVVTLVPVPQSGKYFGIWGNAASGNANPLYFTVTNANQTVSSLFASLSGGQAALAVIPSGFGTVTVNPQANPYNVGAGVTLTAVPDPGQIFLGWSGDATGNSNPLGITMTTSKTITGNFSSLPRLTAVPPVEGLFNDGFRFTLHGEYNRNYQIDVSTNLPNWSGLTVLTNYYDQVQYLDAAATNGTIRLYRALRLP